MARDLQTNCNSRLIRFQYLIYHKVPISSELPVAADVPIYHHGKHGVLAVAHFTHAILIPVLGLIVSFNPNDR